MRLRCDQAQIVEQNVGLERYEQLPLDQRNVHLGHGNKPRSGQSAENMFSRARRCTRGARRHALTRATMWGSAVDILLDCRRLKCLEMFQMHFCKNPDDAARMEKPAACDRTVTEALHQKRKQQKFVNPPPKHGLGNHFRKRSLIWDGVAPRKVG